MYYSCVDTSRELYIGRGSINKCCQGKIKTCGAPKLYFKFFDKEDNLVNMKIKKEKKKYVIIKRKISVYDKDDNLLEICKNIAEAK